jgi:hypothetical protein
MRQRLVKGFFIFVFYLISSIAFAQGGHLAELKSKFPYGLLSDDYGILNVNDLAINACIAEPRIFNPDNRYHSYEYWQCFESKTISFSCSSNGISDKYEGIMGLVTVKVSSEHGQHEYIERRPWPIKECKGFLNDAAALLKGTRNACISGSFIEPESGDSSYPTFSWVFERLKTKKGCEGHDCVLTKNFKRDICPNIKL